MKNLYQVGYFDGNEFNENSDFEVLATSRKEVIGIFNQKRLSGVIPSDSKLVEVTKLIAPKK